MNTSQRMRYHITGYHFAEISKGQGSIEYQLMDDFGNERTVTAMAKTNLFKKVTSIRPIYHRELPLIQALANKQLNDSVIVDFSKYNRDYPRDLVKNRKLSTPSVRVSHLGTSEITDLSSLLDNKTRFVQLLCASVIGFCAFNYVISQIPSPFA